MESFYEIYERLKAEPTPGAKFVSVIAQVCNRKESTVRKWLARETNPDANVQIILEKYLETPKETLFPDIFK